MDADDWTVLFEARRGALVDGARRITGDRAEAEDVVQDAWLKLHAGGDGLRVPAAWLATIVRNLAIDRLRHRELARRLVDGLTAEPGMASVTPEDAVAMRREAAAVLARMVASLNEADVVALVLRDVFGEDLATLARLSRRSAGALRVALHRALRRLRELQPGDDGFATPRAARIFAICWQAIESRDATLLRAVLVDACRTSANDPTGAALAVRMTFVSDEGRFRLGLRQGGVRLCILPIGVPDRMIAMVD